MTEECKLDVIKIADLGISKYISSSTEADSYGGTKQYMSPEQSNGIHPFIYKETYETHSFNTDVW